MKKFKITFSYITDLHQRIKFNACINAFDIDSARISAKEEIKYYDAGHFIKIESCFCDSSNDSYLKLYNIFPVL